MRITSNRILSNNDASLSHVHVESFECFGLEDEYRVEKLVDETRIPAGLYKIKVRNHGGFNIRYSNRFPTFHKGMLEICDVPGFTDILIHVGNDDDDTSGCLLLGKLADLAGGLKVLQSVNAYREFYKIVIQAAIHGDLEIEINNHDLESLYRWRC